MGRISASRTHEPSGRARAPAERRQIETSDSATRVREKKQCFGFFGFQPVFTEKTEIPKNLNFKNRTENRSNRVDRFGSVYSVRFVRFGFEMNSPRGLSRVHVLRDKNAL